MWQAPNAKARSPGKKSARSRGRGTLHIKRVTAEIRGVGETAIREDSATEGMARLLLNDLTAKGVAVFCTHAFPAGQEVAILVPLPTQIYLRGRVMFCQEREFTTAIISPQPFAYRIGIEFIFENLVEEAAVKKYCEDVMKSLYSAAA